MIERMRTADWRLRALVVVIALQIAIPLVAFFGEPPSRFGFHMYSGQGQVDVEIRDRKGEVVPFDYTAAVASFRPEIDWGRYLPAQLCREAPGAHVVTVVQHGRQSSLTCD
jgi:hypothetical protein